MNTEDIRNLLTSSIFSNIDRRKLEEVIKDCEVKGFNNGDYIFRRDEYGDVCGVILSGMVRVEIPKKISAFTNNKILLQKGDLCGEIALLSGHQRIADVIGFMQPLRVLFIPKDVLHKLTDTFPLVKDRIDQRYRERVLFSFLRNLPIFKDIDDAFLKELVLKATIHTYRKNETIFRHGDKADGLYFIRFGEVKIYEKEKAGKEEVLAFLKEQQYFGEMAFFGSKRVRTANTVASCRTELVKIPADYFQIMLQSRPDIKRVIERIVEQREDRNVQAHTDDSLKKTLSTVLDSGVEQDSYLILIDLSKCMHCDNCVKACAAMHRGYSRLTRRGMKLNNIILIPTSCRLCDDPTCMSKCPTNSIVKDLSGEIYHKDTCIGCGMCERNCPYGNITMYELPASASKKWSGGNHSADNGDSKETNMPGKRAGTCDKCKGRKYYACVYNCPVGAVRRVDPEEFFTLITTIG
ncbi:MAG: cyclic nucleotide-binding domain-containing protein [Candidatus Anammoxibacter sp.]